MQILSLDLIPRTVDVPIVDSIYGSGVDVRLRTIDKAVAKTNYNPPPLFFSRLLSTNLKSTILPTFESVHPTSQFVYRGIFSRVLIKVVSNAKYNYLVSSIIGFK